MIPVDKIKYLAFEGGGGKGVAYLGAIEALEEKGVLPISDDNRQVLGISGSSTGAINALMLSLHMSSTEIENELKNKNFEEFYTKDNPSNAIFRAVYTPRDKSNNPLKPGGFKNKNQIIIGYKNGKIRI
jgi:NTE family protein